MESPIFPYKNFYSRSDCLYSRDISDFIDKKKNKNLIIVNLIKSFNSPMSC